VSINKVNTYDVDSHIAEIYDTCWETDAEDAEYLRGLLRGCGARRILEPFCGTGRLLIPLAQEGCELVGMDQSKGMLHRARMKIAQLPAEIQRRIALIEADVTSQPWPTGFDAVILGCNCFYELATAEEQEGCIISAAQALRPGGWVFIDHDSMEGELAASWRESALCGESGVPTVMASRSLLTLLRGLKPLACADGTLFRFHGETVWFDAPRRLHRSHGYCLVTFPDGREELTDGIRQKHPASAQETRDWLIEHGFFVKDFTDGVGGPSWKSGDGRATFWARKQG
jgi:SAM-dependent methyltransferase